MFIGGTGNGKTSSINTAVHHLFDAKFDEARRHLVEEKEKEHGQAVSQTDDVIPYFIEPTANDHLFTLIDTPGFGDTRNCDSDHIEKLEGCFKKIGEIDAIIFVIKSSDSRLNTALKDVFDSVLSLFGENVSNNIFILFTFSTSKRAPPALDAIKKDKIPYQQYYLIDNEVFNSVTNDDDMDEKDDRRLYDKTMKTMAELFEDIAATNTVSLELTGKVLAERDRLQNVMSVLPNEVNLVLDKLSGIQRTYDEIEQNEKNMEENKDYKIKTTVEETVKTPTATWNCLNISSERTCQIGVWVNSEAWCHCMYWNGSCSICGADYSAHSIQKSKYETKTKEIETTKKELFDKYKDAESNKSEKEQILDGLNKEHLNKKIDVYKMIKKVARSITRLNKIALRPNTKTPTEYVNDLIQKELEYQQEGYKKRIEQLEELLTYIATEPFEEYDDDNDDFLQGGI